MLKEKQKKDKQPEVSNTAETDNSSVDVDIEDIEDDADSGKTRNTSSLKKTLIIASVAIVIAVGFFVMFSKDEVVVKGSDNVYTERKVQEVVSEVMKKNDETIQAIKNLEGKIEKMQAGEGGGLTKILEGFEGISKDILVEGNKKQKSPESQHLKGYDAEQPAPAPKRPSLKKQELSFMQGSNAGGNISLASGNNTDGNMPAVSAVVKSTPKNPAFLPAATLVEGVMVTGALAPVKGADAAFKSPTVLIRLTRNGITANLKTIPIKDAFILARAEGIWNLERVVMETTKFVMVMNDGKVVETKITGQIQSGDDGIDGVPGMIVNPGETERMLKFFGGSTMSGIFAAMGQMQQRESTTAFGTTKTIDDELLYSLATGISKTWDNFSQWYLEQAKQAKPFVAVEPGKKVFILIQDGVKIDV
jgi:hypothetical protein